jgi:putative CocE/NonD family hydrolase
MSQSVTHESFGCGRAGRRARLTRYLVAAAALFVIEWLLNGQAAALEPRPGALEVPTGAYAVDVAKEIWIPMRDGVRLAADLYRPRGIAGTLPVILIRTPYSKDLWPPADARFFASHGFAVVVQDFRGRHKSEGLYRFNRGHRQDGYDTFAWVMHQPWSSGRIGSYGCSYLGEVQVYQAPALPPGLTAMIPQAAGLAVGSAGGYYHNAQGLGSGAYPIGLVFWWFHRHGSQLYYGPRNAFDLEPALNAKLAEFFRVAPALPENIDYNAVLQTLPVVDMMQRIPAPPNEFADFVRHNVDLTDPWWKNFDYITEDTKIDAPALYIESWNDVSADGALYLRGLFEKNANSQTARDNQFIIVAPGSHCESEDATTETYVGDQFVGDARFGHLDIYLKWFRYWLMGERNGITDMPKVQYYVIGKNEWRASSAWPVPGTRYDKYYLRSGGQANSHFGDGWLSLDPPQAEPPDAIVYDPASPAPTLGINDYTHAKPITDQRPLSARHDVLVYTSEPLTAGFEMTGEIGVHLYISSSARDTDFVVKLVDVHPDGLPLNVREMIQRVRYRNGRGQPAALMTPGEICELKFKLGAYSQYFAPGHRVRVQITSSSMPRFDRNLNTGGNNYDESVGVVARNVVLHDREHPSHIILPVVPE